LGEFARGFGDEAEDEFSLSSSNGWTIREDDSIIGGFIAIVYFGARNEMGSLLAID
jgi:hypothetical protein